LGVAVLARLPARDRLGRGVHGFGHGVPRIDPPALALHRSLGRGDRVRGGRGSAAEASVIRGRAKGALLAIALLAACSSSGSVVEHTPPPVPPKDRSPSAVPTGPGSAAAARAALCDVPKQSAPPAPSAEGTPPAIAEVEH